MAKLAGVPDKVISRAKVILDQLETEGVPLPAVSAAPEDGQFSLGDLGAQSVADRLRAVDVDTLTPIEAMNLLYEMRKEL